MSWRGFLSGGHGVTRWCVEKLRTTVEQTAKPHRNDGVLYLRKQFFLPMIADANALFSGRLGLVLHLLCHSWLHAPAASHTVARFLRS